MSEQIVQIIKYEGDNATFIWKHPIEDFNTGTQLIVHESQEAIFVMNGQTLDLFGAGRYTLETQNIPLIRKIFNRTTDDIAPFHCEVYFINKTEQMGIKWGMDSKVNYIDPNYNNYPFQVGASGEMSLQVSDSRKLLLKLVGTVGSLGQMTLSSYFKAPMMMRIKSYLPTVLTRKGASIFDIDKYMVDFSDELHTMLASDFADYGIEIKKFWITSLVKPEDDPTYREIRSLQGGGVTAIGRAKLDQQVGIINQQTQAQRMVIESQALAQKRNQEGYTFQQERGFDVAEKVAQNEGIGNFSSTGIGLGMMGGVAGGMGAAVAGITAGVLNPIIANPQQEGAQSSFTNPVSGFDSGPQIIDLKKETPENAPVTKAAQPGTDEITAFKQKLEKLKMMKEMELLSDEEFAEEKKNLLSSL